MTSHIIDQVKRKETSPRWRPADDGTFCAFCRIIYEGARAHKVYEDDHVIGILGKFYSSQKAPLQRPIA